MKKIVLFVILIAIVLGAIKLIKDKKEDLSSLETAKKPIFSVNVVNEEKRTITQSSSFTAKLEASNSINLATKVSGFIEKIYVSENDIVKKGTLLIKIDSSEIVESLNQIKNSLKSIEFSIESLSANINSLENDLKASKNRFNRNNILYKAGGLSLEKLESSEVEYKIKKAKLDSTAKSIEAKKYELKAMKNSYDSKKASLEYYNIKASQDGVVGNIFLNNGDLCTAGKPILNLLDTKQKLTFLFASHDIKEGLEVLINNQKKQNKQIKAKITKVLKSASNSLYQGEISLDSNNSLDLPINSFLEIEVITKKATEFSLPSNTILYKKDGTYVLIYENKLFKFKKVEIVLANDEFVVLTERIKQKVALASESKLAILPVSNNYKIVEK